MKTARSLLSRRLLCYSPLLPDSELARDCYPALVPPSAVASTERLRTMSTKPTLHEAKVDWSLAEELPVHPANVFLAQFTPDHHVLSFGYVAPPLAADPSKITNVQSKPIVRILVTPKGMKELIEVLQQN